MGNKEVETKDEAQAEVQIEGKQEAPEIEKEEKKKVNWEFDKTESVIKISTDSVKADQENRFRFILKKYKDKKTYEESLKILSQYKVGVDADYKDNGSIVTSISDLYNDIKLLKKYGVVMESTYFHKLCKEIERCYLDIDITEVSIADTDKRFTNLIDQIKQYLTEDETLITKELCYVPVNTFNEIALECGYYSYEMNELRASLDKDGFIRTVSGRFAIAKRIKVASGAEKVMRVVAFLRKELNLELPKSKESEVAVKGKEKEKANET